MRETVPLPWFGIHSIPSGPRVPSAGRPAGRRARDLAVARFPEWLERVKAQLGGELEEVLEPMRRVERALRAAPAAA
jgi:hypothetical protein